MIANNGEKQQKLFAKAIILKFTDVIKYTRKHRAVTNYITCKSFLCDVISRSRNRLLSPSKVRFTPC